VVVGACTISNGMDNNEYFARKEEKEKIKKEAGRDQMIKKSLRWLGFVVLAGLFVWWIYGYSQDAAVKKSATVGEYFQAQSRDHIQSGAEHPAYNSNPPTSGPHVNNKAPWGVSKEILPKELQIHNLEDGGVIIQYNPEKVTPEEITLLEKIVNQKRESIIVAPYYDMEYKIALTAWNRLLPLENVEEKQIDVFIGRYAGKDHHVRNPNL